MSSYPEENPFTHDEHRVERQAISGQLNEQTSEQFIAIKLNSGSFAAEYACDDEFLRSQPRQQIVILTCMDHRLDIYKILGLNPGDAHIIRNAGAVPTDDVMRSLAISHKLGNTQSIFVIKHTGCEMLTFDNHQMDTLMAESYTTAVESPSDPVTEPDYNEREYSPLKRYNYTKIPNQKFKILGDEWMTMTHGIENSVIETVRILRNSDVIPPYTPIYGFYFEHKSGRLIKVDRAFKIGQSQAII